MGFLLGIPQGTCPFLGSCKEVPAGDLQEQEFLKEEKGPFLRAVATPLRPGQRSSRFSFQALWRHFGGQCQNMCTQASTHCPAKDLKLACEKVMNR